jgi:2-polyprenyl-3-methyl-5-hydroxy-6-metoxy-1,4-benzoquinol methylase
MQNSEKKMKPIDPNRVETYFDLESTHWNEIYQRQDVYSVIHQDRRLTALRFFDELCLPRTARILEIGCGAGLTTIDIARRGYSVTAVDSSSAMVELAWQNAQTFEVASRVSIRQADIYHLGYEERSFDLVIALGVLPWLPDLPGGVDVISRLVDRGGHVLVNIDNRYRLNHLLNPSKNPLLSAIKEDLKGWAERAGVVKPSATPPVKMFSVEEFKELLSRCGLDVELHRMLGFGPFQFFNLPLLDEKTGVRVNRYFQRLADDGHPLFRRVGAQYLVLAVEKSLERFG